jgi:hypothetical protein
MADGAKNNTEGPSGNAVQPVAISAPLASVLRTDMGLSATNLFRGLGVGDLQRRLESLLPAGGVAKRDSVFAELGRLFPGDANLANVRCLVGEHVSIGTHGNPGRYNIAILWCSFGQEEMPSGRLKDLGGIGVTKEAWPLVETIAAQLIREGDSANEVQSSVLDVVLVHYFDGKVWKTGQYFNFEQLQTGYQGAAGRIGTLLYMLLHCVNQGISAEAGFMESRYCSYLDQMKREMLQSSRGIPVTHT